MVLMLQESSNAIVAPIEINLDKLEKLEEVVKRMRSADSKIPKQDQKLSYEDDTIENTFKGMLSRGTGGGSAAAGIHNVQSLASNPMGFILNIVSNPYVAAAILGAASAKVILDNLMLQGNILDKHFKRILANEANVGRRLHSRQAIRAGLGDQVIITNRSGSTSPAYAANTYASVRKGEIDSMKAFQIRRGYKF